MPSGEFVPRNVRRAYTRKHTVIAMKTSYLSGMLQKGTLVVKHEVLYTLYYGKT